MVVKGLGFLRCRFLSFSGFTKFVRGAIWYGARVMHRCFVSRTNAWSLGTFNRRSFYV